jgi:ArsR family metal-binding transcriptional regulator
MIKKLIENFKKGIEKFRWFAALFSERIKIEIAVFRLLYQHDEMSKKKDEILIKIGQRVVELRDNTERNIFKDRLIAESLIEIEGLDKSINELKQKAGEISRVAE